MLKFTAKPALLAFIAGLIVLAGCAAPYTPAPQILPANIRKLYVKPFANNTTQYGLEDKLTLAVVNEFISDGRLSIANTEDEADGILIGEINKYILQPLTMDSNMVTEQYKLWILLNVYFVDKANNVTLWSEPNMEGIQIFYDASRPGGITEEEARENIWANLSRSIAKRAIQGFGSVSGQSENKVPR